MTVLQTRLQTHLQTGSKNLQTWLPFLISLGVVIAVVVALSKRMDYHWQWHKLPQYVVQTEIEVKAPFDGFVQLDNKSQITLQDMRSGQKAVLSGLTEVLSGPGDLVFAGDVLARKTGLQAGPLLKGLGITLLLSALAGGLGLGLAVVVLWMRLSGSFTLRTWAKIYIEVIRGTPLLVQLFVLYFFVGEWLHIGAFTAGVVSLTLFVAAYVAEIWRGSLESLPQGQHEAAKVLGLSDLQSFRHVLIPQAISQSRPALVGQLISLIKDSSLVSVLAINDLSHAGREIVGSAFNPFEVWLTVAALYLCLTLGLSLATSGLTSGKKA